MARGGIASTINFTAHFRTSGDIFTDPMANTRVVAELVDEFETQTSYRGIRK